LTARNTLFAIKKIIGAPKNLKNGRVPYLGLELTNLKVTMHVKKPNPSRETVSLMVISELFWLLSKGICRQRLSYRGDNVLHLVPGDDPVTVEVVHVEGPPQLLLLAPLHQDGEPEGKVLHVKLSQNPYL
jgi:hypothetical protein